MKKFLSMLLAVMMVISPVSFAIPSAIGAVDTATEAPVDVVPEATVSEEAEETASLSAVLPATDAELGELIVNVHLDSATEGAAITASTWGQHSNGMTGSLASNNLQFNNNGTYKNDGSNGFAQFTLPLSTGQTFRYGGFSYSGEAGYTYTMAVDFRTTLTAGNLPASGDKLQFNGNDAGLSQAISTVADGEWHTYTYPLALDGAYTISNLYAMLYAHSNASAGLAGTLDVDNIRLYKKPSIATVTFKADGKTLGTASLSTAGVTAQAIIDAASVPASKTVTGISISGTSYTLSDTVVLGGDCTVEITLVDNPNYDAELGIKVIESGFEAFAVGDAIPAATTTLAGKDVTLADWPNFKGSGYWFELGGGAGAGSIAGDASNKYVTLPSMPSGSWFRFRPNVWSDANGIAGSGIVTVSFDARVNGTWNSSGYNHYAPHYGSAENSSNRVNFTLNTDGEWHRYTSAGFGDNGTTPVSTIMLRLAMTSGSVDIDNFAYWIKQPTTTITFTSNGKIVDTKENVETTGLLVSDLVSDVSVNPSKLITGISYGGKTFGLDETAYFGGDNEVELVLVDNPNYDAEKGVLIAYSTFDALTSGTTYGNYVNVFSTFTGSYKGPDFASTNLYLQSDAADGHEFVDGAVKYQLKPNSNGARGFIFYGNTSAQYDAVAPAGVVTFEMDMKLEGASAAATSTTDYNMMRVIAQKDVVAKDHKPLFLPNDNTWHTYSFVTAGDHIGGIQLYQNVPSTTTPYVYLDNFKIYWKPETANITVESDGNVVEEISNAPTTGVLVSELLSGVTSPSVKYVIDGIQFNGKSYGMNDTVYFGGDNTVELVVIDNPNYDAELGVKVIESGFEAFAVGDAIPAATTVLAGKDVTLADWPNFKGSGYWFELGGGAGAGSIAGDASNKYVTLPSLPSGSWFRLRPNIWSDANGIAGSGIVTVSFDARVNGTWNSSGYNHYAPHYGSAENSSNRVNFTLNTDGEWHSYTSAGFGDNGTTPVSTIMLRLAMTSGSVDIDNFAYWIKQPTTTVTIKYGDTVLKTVENVPTTGKLVSELLAGIESPDMTKVITGISYAGKTVGMDEMAYFGGDNVVELVIEDNDAYDAEHGLLTVDFDFDLATPGTTVANHANAETKLGYSKFNTALHRDDFVQFHYELGSASAAGAVGTSGNALEITSTGAYASMYAMLRSDPYKVDMYSGKIDGGVFTYVYDAKYSAAPASASITVNCAGTEYDAAASFDGVADPTAWNTYTVVYNAEGKAEAPRYHNLKTNFTAAATTNKATYDNWKIYWKPATTTVTIKYGDAVVKTVENVPTDGKLVSELVAGIESPDSSKVITGITYGGKTVGMDELAYFGGDNVVEIALGVNENFDPVKGLKMFAIDFEDAAVGTTGNYPNVETALKGYVGDVKTSGGLIWYSPSATDAAIAEENGNKFYTRSLTGVSAEVVSGIYGFETGKQFLPFVDTGIYTFDFSAKFSGTQHAGNYHHVRWTASTQAGLEDSDFTVPADNAWHDYSFTVDGTEWNNFGGFQFRQYATGTLSFDNVAFYVKEATANITVMDGDVVAVTKTNAPTTGILVSELLGDYVAEDSSVVITGVEFNGKTYGLDEMLVVAADSTVNLATKPARDYSLLGEVVVDINMDNFTEFGTTQSITPLNTTVVPNSIWLETRKGVAIETEADGKYLTSPTSNGVTAFRVRANVWDTTLKLVQDGVLTLKWDMRLDSITDAQHNMVRVVHNNVGTSSESNIAPTANEPFKADGKWHTYDYSVETSNDFWVGSIGVYLNTTQFDIKNVQLIWKPTTATVTVMDGETKLGSNTVSTTGALVSEIVSGLSVDKTRMISGIIYKGETYGLNDTIVIPGNVSVGVTTIPNPNYDATDGDRIIFVDMNTYDTFGQYQSVDKSVRDATKVKNPIWIESGAAPSFKEEDAGKYITVPSAPGIAKFKLRANIWDTTVKLAEDGVLTFKWDMRASSITNAAYNTVRYVDSSVSSGTEHDISPTNNEAFIADGNWHSYEYSVNSAEKWVGGLLIYVNTNSVDIKNVQLFWKPATTTATFVDADGNVLATETISTTGESFTKLAGFIDVPLSKKVSSMIFNGTEYTEGSTIVVGENPVITVNFDANEWFYNPYGEMLYKVHFENGTSTAQWQNIANWGADVNPTTYPDRTGSSYDHVQANGWAVTDKLATESGNTYYTESLAAGTAKTFDFGRATAAAGWTAIRGAGTYTLTMRVKSNVDISAATATFDGVAGTGNNTFVKNQWNTAVWTATVDAAGAHIIPSFTLASAGTLSWDDFTLYFKPATANVTINPGEYEGLVDTQTFEMTTGGFTVAQIDALVSHSATAKQIVALVDESGTRYTGSTMIYIAEDAAFTAEWGYGDGFNPEIGTMVVEVDADDYTTIAQTQPITPIDTTIIPKSIWFETRDGVSVKEDATGKYFNVKNANNTTMNGVAAFRIRSNIWTATEYLVNSGIVTLVWDMRSDSITDAQYNMVRIVNNNNSSSTETNISASTNEDFIGDGQWHTYSASVSTEDMWVGAMSVYVNSASIDVRNVRIYYKPTTATVTIKEGNNEASATLPTTSTTVQDIVDAVNFVGKNPYMQIVGINYDGTTYALSDTLTFASDITVSPVWGDKDGVSAENGEVFIAVDFENTNATSYANGTHNNMVTALGADVTFNTEGLTDPATELYFRPSGFNYTVVTDGTNKYLQAPVYSANGATFFGFDGFTYVGQTGTMWSPISGAGVYTITFRYKLDNTVTYGTVAEGTAYNLVRFVEADAGTDYVNVNFTMTADGAWHTATVSAELTEFSGVQFFQYFTGSGNIAIDDYQVWYKPTTANVTFKYTDVDGVEQTATPEKTVTTAGITAADLTSGVKARGYEIKGVSYAGVDYALNSEDLIKFAFENETVYLIVEKLPISEFAPETKATAGVRTDDPTGLRFSATMLTNDGTVEKAGWVVTRQTLLTGANIAVDEFNLDSNVKKVTGYNIEPGKADKIFASENDIDTFTAVLTGIGADYYDEVIVAVPFVIDYDTWYGEAFVGTYRKAAQSILNSGVELTMAQKALLTEIVNA